MSNKLFNVGKIVNTHGVKGELKVFPMTDFPEVRFQKGSKLCLIHPEKKTELTVTVASSRLQKNLYVVKFSEWHDINDVEQYKGWELKVREEDLLQLEEDEYYYHEIVGCQVVTEDETVLGTIIEILNPGANDVWVVDRPNNKHVLIPVIDDVVLSVDVEAKIVRIHLMDGLI